MGYPVNRFILTNGQSSTVNKVPDFIKMTIFHKIEFVYSWVIEIFKNECTLCSRIWNLLICQVQSVSLTLLSHRRSLLIFPPFFSIFWIQTRALEFRASSLNIHFSHKTSMISHSKNQKTATSIFVRSMVQTSSDSKL